REERRPPLVSRRRRAAISLDHRLGRSRRAPEDHQGAHARAARRGRSAPAGRLRARHRPPDSGRRAADLSRLGPRLPAPAGSDVGRAHCCLLQGGARSKRMKFGIFYEHQLPRPWGPKSEYQLLQDSLCQIELADQLGYDYAWEVEHHFLEEYSHSSAPEVFLGAASQRTKRIRLGHGVVQLTTNQPHRVAERVATLDLLSGGRVDLGMGEAAGPAELHPFGIRVRDKRERWEEAVKAIIPMFTRESWEF